jgi:feruloyl-CoA synthase
MSWEAAEHMSTETFAAPDTTIEHRPDGTIILRASRDLDDYESSIAAVLRARAAAHPDRTLAAQRGGDGGWQTVSYSEAREQADALAGSLLDLELGPDRPLMVLSANSVEHLVLSLAAYTAGVPVMPISVAYSLMSADHARIRAIAELTRPGLIFADDPGPFAKALDSLDEFGAQALVARGERVGALQLADLFRPTPVAAVESAYRAVGPDTVVKLLFTSGSTGVPKGVINTNRMLCSNQATLQRIWPFLATEPPVLVDWLPWSHTFGANHNLNLVLFNGGTLYIDDGRPVLPLFPRTISALNDVAPTVYFNVPAGFALLAGALESDRALAEHFFSRLRFMFYAGAALPDALAVRLRKIAERNADHEVPLTSSWGATETSPAATSAHFADAVIGCMGVPLASTTIKLAPEADKLEIRVKGPNVTPGYFKRPELAEAAFDDEGFYRSGDAVKLVDESDPNKGLLFDGRIAEDFKLLTGTWVTVGPLRTRLLSAAGVLTDAVICGHNEPYVGALAWVNQAEAAKVCASDSLDDPRLRDHLARSLAELAAGEGSSLRVERLLLLSEPPSLDAGEITDKGYLNQRACLECRAGEVARLYGAEPDPAVITPA